MKELRPIPNTGYYFVDRDGQIYSDHPRRLKDKGFRAMKLQKHSQGYLFVRLSTDVGCYGKLAHQAVMEAFVGSPRDGMMINHKDGDKHNNSLDNLEYVTRRQNEDHAMAHGLKPKGDRNGASKVTESDVRHILCTPLSISNTKLANDVGLTRSQVSRIRRGKSWGWMKQTVSQK